MKRSITKFGAMCMSAALLAASVQMNTFSVTPAAGDMNGDGRIDPSDASEALAIYTDCQTQSSGIFTVSSQEMDLGDVNGDGIIDPADASLILTQYVKSMTGKPQYMPGTVNLMSEFKSQSVIENQTDAQFIGSMADFSLELFKRSLSDENENTLISPISVMLALSMTANGADGETLSQMEKMLGGDININELNKYLYSYIQNLPSSEKAKLGIANSIWFRDDESLTVKPEFLQTNADYYNAEAFKAAFDDATKDDINNWVSYNTDGMIDKILEEIPPEAVMYLINAVVFDAEWENVYALEEVSHGTFKDINGDIKQVEYMSQRGRGQKYFEDENAVGFMKPYAGGDYGFAAILPNEDIDINEYISSLTGQKFVDMMDSAQYSDVQPYLPKFSYKYSLSMIKALKDMGMTDAFNDGNADFRNMAESSFSNIFLSAVEHKTFISVDELGTRAGAVTLVEASVNSVPKVICLNRPFIYAIVDNATNLPVFIGTVMTF